MYEDDDERMDAAEQLARLDPRAGAEAFRAIAGDEDADDERRIDAAEQLAGLDRRAAAEAFRAIACDESVDDGLRVEAAERLPGLDRRTAAEAFRVIACDESVDDGLRSAAAEQLPELDRRAAAEAFRVIACDESVDDGLRSPAASSYPTWTRGPLPRRSGSSSPTQAWMTDYAPQPPRARQAQPASRRVGDDSNDGNGAASPGTRTPPATLGVDQPTRKSARRKRTVEDQCHSAVTAANTAAKPLDNTGPVQTTVECRPSAQTAMDGPGRLASAYGSEGHSFCLAAGPRSLALPAVRLGLPPDQS